MALRRDNKIKNNFSKISISLASSEEIFENSSGEVLKPGTINHRTYKLERDGLFCKRIFGPTKDYKCHCGKYECIRYKGIACDRRGVGVTEKKIRCEHTGHIQLVVPAVHVWYFRSFFNKTGYLLDLPTKKFDVIICHECYAVIQPGILEGEVVQFDLLEEGEYLDLLEKLPSDNRYLEDSDFDELIAKMGVEATYDLLPHIDLDSSFYRLCNRTGSDTSQQRKTEALKRLQVVESFHTSRGRSKSEWMVVCIAPVIPPGLRPLVPLDGDYFATLGPNDLYRRVTIRNNHLRKLIKVKTPEVILRNEKHMLQKSIDSLFDNPCKLSAVKIDANHSSKSLSDSLKGKQGRFRQSLLSKRVGYSARPVIIVGPGLKMGEYGTSKLMAAELHKLFITRKLIECGIVKTVESAKGIVDRKEPVIWDILEHVMKRHLVLLNCAPTSHRPGIQTFQSKMIEGKAVQLHPLACTTFDVDFDGGQMAVHLPLSNEAILEAQMLMLRSYNISNPANSTSTTVPVQGMVLGLYYIIKLCRGTEGEGLTFYGPGETLIVCSEGKCDIHAPISVIMEDVDGNGNTVDKMTYDTSVGRVIVNETIPARAGYTDMIISKKPFRDTIGHAIEVCGVAGAVEFPSGIENLGHQMAFKGSPLLDLGDIIILEEKEAPVRRGYEEVEQVVDNYNMGLIINNERYNQMIDIWTRVNPELSNILMRTISSGGQGFSSIYMVLDSGARGFKEQTCQPSDMRDLMAKPQKADAEDSQIIENPILPNFKEGLSVSEYFIPAHSTRKDLVDTALKTVDTGHLTRRSVDVSHDAIINREGCGIPRGPVCMALKNNNETIVTLYECILGRVPIHDTVRPTTGELLTAGGEEITEATARKVEDSPIGNVKIRLVLIYESEKGVYARCYGYNLVISCMVQKGEAVGMIATQSIGGPGIQLALHTFHVGGAAANIAADASIAARNPSRLKSEELRMVDIIDEADEPAKAMVGRLAEVRFAGVNTGVILPIHDVLYGSTLYAASDEAVEKGKPIACQDLLDAVVVIEATGKAESEGAIEDVIHKVEFDEFTGLHEIIIVESKGKTKVSTAHTTTEDNELTRMYNPPVDGHMVVEDSQKVEVGGIIVKTPCTAGKAGNTTGGLPCVTELFEARSPPSFVVVSETDGEATMGKVKRGNRETIVTSKTGEVRRYLVPLSKQALTQENDYMRAGTPLSDGATTPADILATKGLMAVQKYIVNEIQDVYRLQGTKINDKYFEIIVRQMVRGVEIDEPGDTRLSEQQVADKLEFMEENNHIWDKEVVVDAGDSQNLQSGQIVTARKLCDENSTLKCRDLKPIVVCDAVPVTSTRIFQGITRAILQTSSFMSAVSFQETTKVLNEAATSGKVDYLEGMKGSIAYGRLVLAGTGQRGCEKIVVGSKEEYDRMFANKKMVPDYAADEKAEE